MVPLGFYFTGKNAVFINVNTKISLLKGMMDKCSQLNKENNVQSEKARYTGYLLQMLPIW